MEAGGQVGPQVFYLTNARHHEFSEKQAALVAQFRSTGHL